MNEKDITALATILSAEYRVPAVIESIISYIKSEYPDLNFKELSLLRRGINEPSLGTDTIKKPVKTPILEVVSKPDPPKPHKIDDTMDIIPKVLCRLREEMGYGVSPEND